MASSNSRIDFFNRWNINRNEQKIFDEFKSRVLNSLCDIIPRNDILLGKLEEVYFKECGYFYDDSRLSYNHFKDTRVFDILRRITTIPEFIYHLQVFFWINLTSDTENKLFKNINADIEKSCIPINIKKIDNDIVFFPSGAHLLDEKLINNNLDWLVNYPKSYNNFSSALEKYLNKSYTRNLVDDLRLSLELLIKDILNNDCSLENQISSLGTFLKSKNISNEIKNMYTKLLDYYTKYQNNYAKHDDIINEHELEFIIYLTGTFMRLLLTI